MAENISPEERLFKVIQKGKQSASEGLKPENGKPGGWFGRLKLLISPGPSVPSGSGKGFDWKRLIPANVELPELEPGDINKILAGVLVIIAMFVVYSSVSKHRDTTKITEAVSKIQATAVSGREKIEPFKAADFYLDGVRKRDIFHPAPKDAPVEIKKEAVGSLNKAAENLKLQGISWGETPKAMILWQDGSDSKMYFLMKDQMIGTTGIRVIEIYKTKVIIGDGKDETELL